MSLTVAPVFANTRRPLQPSQRLTNYAIEGLEVIDNHEKIRGLEDRMTDPEKDMRYKDHVLGKHRRIMSKIDHEYSRTEKAVQKTRAIMNSTQIVERMTSSFNLINSSNDGKTLSETEELQVSMLKKILVKLQLPEEILQKQYRDQFEHFLKTGQRPNLAAADRFAPSDDKECERVLGHRNVEAHVSGVGFSVSGVAQVVKAMDEEIIQLKTDLREEKSAHQTFRENAESDLEARQNEWNGERETFRSQITEYKAASEAAAAATTKVESLESALEKLQDEYDSLKAISEQQEDTATENEELTKQNDNLSARVNELQIECDRVTSERDNLQGSNTNTNDQIREQIEKIKSLEEKVSEMEREASDKDAEIQQLRESERLKTKDNTTLRASVKAYENACRHVLKVHCSGEADLDLELLNPILKSGKLDMFALGRTNTPTPIQPFAGAYFGLQNDTVSVLNMIADVEGIQSAGATRDIIISFENQVLDGLRERSNPSEVLLWYGFAINQLTFSESGLPFATTCSVLEQLHLQHPFRDQREWQQVISRTLHERYERKPGQEIPFIDQVCLYHLHHVTGLQLDYSTSSQPYIAWQGSSPTELPHVVELAAQVSIPAGAGVAHHQEGQDRLIAIHDSAGEHVFVRKGQVEWLAWSGFGMKLNLRDSDTWRCDVVDSDGNSVVEFYIGQRTDFGQYVAQFHAQELRDAAEAELEQLNLDMSILDEDEGDGMQIDE